MSEAGAGHVFGAAAVFHVRAGRGDHLGRALGDHLDAEELVGLGAGDDLDETRGAVGSDRAAVAGELELTDGDFDVLGLGFGFGEADAGDFGVGVDDARDDAVVHVALLAGEVLGDRDAFFFGLVREHRAGDDVTDGVDAGQVGLVVSVDDDAAALVELEAGLLGAEAGRVGLAADGDEDLVSGEFEGLAVAFGGESGARGGLLDAGDLGAQFELQALLLESVLRGLGDISVVGGAADAREHLDDRDLGAETGPDGTEFEADGAGADDDHLLRHGLQRDAVVGGDDGLSVELHEGQFDRHRAGGDEDVLGLERAVTGRGADEHLAGLNETAEAADDFDVTLLEQRADAHVELRDDLVLVGEHRGDVEGELLAADEAMLLAVDGVLVDFGGVEQGLGGDAADVEAGAAEGVVLLHEGHLEAELAGFDGGDIATRAGADYDEIELRHCGRK